MIANRDVDERTQYIRTRHQRDDSFILGCFGRGLQISVFDLTVLP